MTNILVVDDDPQLRAALSRALRLEGFAVTEAVDGAEALERINACMGEAIPWAPGLPLRGDGYETPFYMKD